MNNLPLQLPVGVRDLLPEEAAIKRRLERDLAGLFQRWAYREVVTPSFELWETIAAQGQIPEEQVLKFIDREGRVAALRPDMTLPLARVVATRLRQAPLPLRLCYLSNVFRMETPHEGRQREFYQAGIELLGEPGPAADAEVVALAVAALELAGVQQYRIGLGHVGLLRGLLAGTSMPVAGYQQIRQALATKDYVTLEGLLAAYEMPTTQRAILTSFGGNGGGLEGLERLERLAPPGCQLILSHLRAVLDQLEVYGVSDRVFFDLSVVRDFDYYTGLVFEGYSPQLGHPLCGGGRYDSLLAQFGWPCAATGFALGLDRVMLARSNQDPNPGEADYLVCGQDYHQVLQRVRQLREAGYRVAASSWPAATAREQARLRGIERVLALEEEEE